MKNPFMPSTSDMLVSITPDQEESIIKEALEFQFPSQPKRRNSWFLKLLILGVLFSSIALFYFFFYKPSHSKPKEFVIDLADPKYNNNLDQLPTPASSILIADGDSLKDNPYYMVFKNLGEKRYRYVVLKETDTPGKAKLSTGYYESTTITNFLELFEEGQHQVGLIYIGPKKTEQLYLMVYIPEEDLDMEDVLKKIDLSPDPKVLADFGLKDVKVLVAKTKHEMQDAQIYADSGLIFFASAPGSEYTEVFQSLAAGEHTWVTLKKDPQSLTKIKVSTGDDGNVWETIQGSFEDGREQVTFAKLGSGDEEQIVMIVYAPSLSHRTLSRGVIDGFHLPSNSAGLAKVGLPSAKIFVTWNFAKETEESILKGARNSA